MGEGAEVVRVEEGDRGRGKMGEKYKNIVRKMC